jgi:hypothetical protein
MKLVAFVTILFCAPICLAQAETSANTVDILVGAPHGLSWESGPDVERRLELVKQHPEAYIPLLEARFDAAELASDEGGEAIRRSENAAQVLAQAGGDAGRTALAAQLSPMETAYDIEGAKLDALATSNVRHTELIAQSQRVSRLARVQTGIIFAFMSVKDPRLRDTLLKRMRRENYAMQSVYLTYFEQTAKGDPVMREQLRPLLEARDSSLFNSPRLRALIEAVP